MTLRLAHGAAEAPPSTELTTAAKSLWTNRRGKPVEPARALERIQIEFELQRAYVAAQVLRERLELAGLNDAARRTRQIQEEIAQTFGRIVDESDVVDAGVACRSCGCTDDRACLGGCSWVEPDLCSACWALGLQEAPIAPG